jgi:hypothetical protein
MKTSLFLSVVFAAALIASPSFAQNPAATASPGGAAMPSDSPKASAAAQSTAPGQMSAADMQKMMAQMMEMSKLNENHKALANLDGTWNCDVKMWMDGDTSKKPDVSKSTAVRKSIMDGRFSMMDVTGKMEMPGPDGKKKEMTFKGMGVDGYDNVKKKFVGTWIDNMGTGIMLAEGNYDPATKTFTYTSEVEMMPGMKTQVREVIKIVDNDHHTFEWYENRGGQDVKTMEINYTRKK